MTVEITCTNGSIKDGSKTVKCSGKDCYTDSYTYCQKLTKGQIAILIIIGIVGLMAAIIISHILSKIPLIGGIGSMLIGLVMLVIIVVIIYVVYHNSKATPKKGS